MNPEYYFGIVATIITLAAFAYQLLKVIRTKETRALSYNLMIWVGLAMLMYVIFGLFYLDEPVIYIGNGIGLVINLMLIGWKYRCEH